MKKNVDTVLNDLSGQPLKNGEQDMTLKVAAVNALMGVYPDEQQLDGSEKAKRYALAQKIHAGGEVDLTSDDLALTKKLIGKAYGPVVVGPAYALIDGD